MREVQSDSAGAPSLDQQSISRPAEIAGSVNQIELLTRSYAKQLVSHARKCEWEFASSLIEKVDSDPRISMGELRRIVSAVHKPGRISTLHFAAMYDAPVQFVDHLLSVFPALDRPGHVRRLSDGVTVHNATALHMALESGHFDIAERLLEAGASVEKVNSLGETPLLTCIKASERNEEFEDRAPGIVRALLEREVPLGIKDKQGRSGLLLSTERGLWDLATILSEAHLKRAEISGASLSTRQELQKCIFAALNHSEEAGGLVENLSELYMQAPAGTEEKISVSDKEQLLAELVPDDYKKFHWIRIQSVIEQALRTPSLFEESFVSDLMLQRNRFGQQVLHVLIESGAPAKVVELALEHGADMEATCYLEIPMAGPVGGFTPLHLCVARDQFDTAKLLLERGVQVDPLSELEETPFDMYIQGRPATLQFEMVSLLLNSGAEVGEKFHGNLVKVLYEAAKSDFTTLKAFNWITDVLPPGLAQQEFEVVSGGEAHKVDYFDMVQHVIELAASVGMNASRVSGMLWKHLGEQIRWLRSPERKLPETANATGDKTLSDDEILDILSAPFDYGEFAHIEYSGHISLDMQLNSNLQIASELLAQGGSLQDVYNYFRSFKVFDEFARQDTQLAQYEEPTDYPFTKLLQPLLFRYPPGLMDSLAGFIEHKFDRNRGIRGWHPYIAEMMALLNHPRDDRKDDATIGSITSSLSSVTRFVDYRVHVTGQVVYDWGRIGTLAFSFPRWRFDCEGHLEVSNEGEKSFSKCLLERAGFRRVNNRSSDVITDLDTGKEEQFLGRGFVFLPGAKLKGGYWKPQPDGSRKLISIGKGTYVELRRAYLMVSDSTGTMLVRNSSTVFGRDTFKHPAYFSPRGCGKGLSVEQLLKLTPGNLAAHGFKHILDPDLYGKGQFIRHSFESPPWFGREAGHEAAMSHLLDQLSAVLEAYSSWKCNTQYDSAWDRDKTGEDALVGGYNSPGFKSLVSFLERRQEEVSMDMLIHGKTWKLLPDLGICRSEFVPWVPDDRLEMTPEVISALRHLADNGMSQFGAFADTGVRDFFNLAMQQQGELVLLAPERRRT